jgi:putative transposase
VGAFKGRVAKHVNAALQRSGPLWQHGFHDHAVRREEDVEQITRYVIENPVRAGLVRTIAEYPYWNTDWWR